MRLTSLDAALALAGALGVRRAPVTIQGPWPAATIAELAGFAVASADLVGAGPHAPVPLPADTRRVRPGEPMPRGCDAVLDPALAIGEAPLLEAIGTPAPGEGARPAGADARMGEMVRAVTAIDRLALAGHTTARPAIHVLGPRGLARDIAALLDADLVSSGGDLGIVVDGSDVPGEAVVAGLALDPARATILVRADVPILILGPRPEARLAALFTIGRALVGLPQLPGFAATTRAKITSTVGLSSFVFCRREGDVVDPIGTDGLALRDLARANGYVSIDPTSEGVPANAPVTFHPFPA